MVGLSDRILVGRLRRRDPDACRELIDRFHGRVFGFLRRLGAGHAAAEDLTQQTYARAWERIDSLREAASLRCWLLAIARNELLQHVRSNDGAPLITGEVPEEPDGSVPADERIAEAERDAVLHRAAARLEPDLREAIVLHYFQDLSYREIGDVLGLPAGTAKSRVSRALLELRRLLDKEENVHAERRSYETTARRP